ncbi:HAD-IA family hydrolase [Candidatus Woesebacteria bacterium]|nr:HAD-IA family hydrolase [Candidatus Woesebacteria bacterium]
MIKVLLFDLSNTVLFAKDKKYVGGLNALHNELQATIPNFVFLDHFELDLSLLSVLQSLQSSYVISLFTSETIQDAPAIKPTLETVFNPIISAKMIGYHKTDPQAYVYIARSLQVKPIEIFFVDDSVKNTQAAAQAGCKTHQYQNVESLNEVLQNLTSL